VVRAESLKCCTTKKAKDIWWHRQKEFVSWNEKLMVEMPLHARSVRHVRGSKQQFQGSSTCCGGQNRTFRFCYAAKLHTSVELWVEGLGREGKRNGVIYTTEYFEESIYIYI